jgi:hypothetical protein
MLIRDNQGKLVGEINTIIRPGEGVITTNTVYSGERVITQNISTRDDKGSGEDRDSLRREGAAVISTLEAHIALDKLRECEQRLRAILVSAQKGEYTRHAFWESIQDVLTEFYTQLMFAIPVHLASKYWPNEKRPKTHEKN